MQVSRQTSRLKKPNSADFAPQPAPGEPASSKDAQTPLRVLMVSKALVVGVYQRKAEEIARLGIELLVCTPPYWRDRRGAQMAESAHTSGYTLRTLPTRCIGDFHLHHYPTLGGLLATFAPHVLHMDEEPYNLATWLALRAADQAGIASTFFTWQNIERRYPMPFRQMEQANYRRAPIAIAGNEDAATVLRAKGYAGTVRVIPQFGVDPAVYAPSESVHGDGVLRIGYAGGLLPEKGIDLLLRACAQLNGAWRLTLAGDGEARAYLNTLAAALGIGDRVEFAGKVDAAAMPAFYAAMDVLVLPSLTRLNWKEQFGRVLIEAMACEVAVVGSSSGEIPNVIGDTGLIFAEGNVEQLAAHLQTLLDNSALRRALAAAGRQRVLERFTMQAIAQATVAVYRSMASRTII